LLRVIYIVSFIFIAGNVLSAQAEWEIAKEADNIQIYTKDHPSNKFKYFKALTTIDQSMETIVAAMLDLHVIPTYYEMIIDIQDINQITPQKASYTIIFDFPWPIKDRFAPVVSEIIQQDDNSVLVTTVLQESDMEKEDMLMVATLNSNWIFTAQGENSTHVNHNGNMDPGGSIPAWLATSGVIDNPFNSVSRFRLVLPKYSNESVGWLK